jgi:hypothetical protein
LRRLADRPAHRGSSASPGAPMARGAPGDPGGAAGGRAVGSSFVDYYEVLQVSANADPETIGRVFRHLAKRHHPDNAETGDRERFEVLLEAHRVLTDPEQRAAYDLRYQDGRARRQELLREAAAVGDDPDDHSLRERILSVLYARRRRDVQNPAMGDLELEQLLGCPRELLEFHVWYLKEKRWVERTERGFAITALGVDEAETDGAEVRRDRLIEANVRGNGKDR